MNYSIHKFKHNRLHQGIALVMMLILGLVLGCKSDNYLVDLSPNNIPAAGTWLIDENDIYWGCSEQDCIPGLTLPVMVPAESPELNYIDDNDLVVGVLQGAQAYAYPHPILDWHEVINAEEYTISYCPLTGSALKITNDLDFGVSGMLYNNNLIMYDKPTNSFWPQMLLVSAAGSKRNTVVTLDRVMETTWGTWRSLYPATTAVSQNTDYNRDYTRYPYGSYKHDNAVYFPLGNTDNRLARKERVLGILNQDSAKVFRIGQMSDISVHHDEIGGEAFVIFGSTTNNFAMAYRTDHHFTVATASIGNGILLFTDTETQSEWTVFGEAVSGPLMGERLEPARAFISYWFAWAAFYPDTEIWDGISQ